MAGKRNNRIGKERTTGIKLGKGGKIGQAKEEKGTVPRKQEGDEQRRNVPKENITCRDKGKCLEMERNHIQP